MRWIVALLLTCQPCVALYGAHFYAPTIPSAECGEAPASSSPLPSTPVAVAPEADSCSPPMFLTLHRNGHRTDSQAEDGETVRVGGVSLCQPGEPFDNLLKTVQATTAAAAAVNATRSARERHWLREQRIQREDEVDHSTPSPALMLGRWHGLLAAAGVAMGYIPLDCTPFSYQRPRRPRWALQLASDLTVLDDVPACDYTSWTTRMLVFAEDGTRIGTPADFARWASALDVTATGREGSLWLVPAGDHFVWPPGPVGSTRIIAGAHVHGAPIELTTVATEPRAFHIPRFITDAEADALIAMAEPTLVDSLGFGANGRNERTAARNSRQTWLACEDDQTAGRPVCTLDERIANTTKIALGHLQRHSDAMQVLRYEEGEHYHAHTDWFDQTQAPDSPGLKEGMNRFVTILYYLTDVPEGGETVFPRAGPTGYGPTAPIGDFADCSRGLKVKPRKGSAIMWYNLHAEGNNHEAIPDHMSLHGACDVVDGVKWAANKWIYNSNWAARNDVASERAEVDAPTPHATGV